MYDELHNYDIKAARTPMHKGASTKKIVLREMSY